MTINQKLESIKKTFQEYNKLNFKLQNFFRTILPKKDIFIEEQDIIVLGKEVEIYSSNKHYSSEVNNISWLDFLYLYNEKTIEDILLKQKVDRNLLLLKDLQEFVNNISLTKLSITDRVNFIEIVLKNLQEYNNSKKEFKFNILIDKYKNVVETSEDIYTLPSKDNQLIVPDFTKIKSVNRELYNTFNQRNNTSGNKSNTRFFYDTFKDYCR